MYDARKISNWLLSEFDAAQWELSNLKLNKILYFIQGWGFVRLDRKIIKNHFVAWQHGPVIRSVWDEFKKFGSQPILEPARYINYASGELEIVSFSDVDYECCGLIKSIAPYYLNKTAGELVCLTHEPAAPWDTVRRRVTGPSLFDRIPDELISSYFKNKFGQRQAH